LLITPSQADVPISIKETQVSHVEKAKIV